MERKQTRGGPTANCCDNTNWFDPSLLKGKEIFMTVRHTGTHTQRYMYTYIFVYVCVCKHTSQRTACKAVYSHINTKQTRRAFLL